MSTGLSLGKLAALIGLSGGVSFGSGIISNAMSASASSSASKRAFNQTLYLQKQNQQWQEKMANTAHQREVQDLLKAGLNPILTASGGSGAATGSGAGGSVSPVQPNIQNPLSTIGDMMSILQSSAQIDQTQATTDNLRQNTSKQSVETLHEFEKITETQAKIEELLTRRDLNLTQRKKLEADLEMVKYLKANIIADTGLKAAQTAAVPKDAETRRIETENNPFKFIKSYLTDKENQNKVNRSLSGWFQTMKSSYR